MSDTWALEMIQIKKHFGGVAALKGVDFKVRKGEVHALLGENGAGKSTLMKILLGAEHYDSGSIILKSREVEIENTGQASELGISMIYQEFNSVPSMTVADNMFLGREPKTAAGLIDYKTMYSKTRSALKTLGVDLRPDETISNLSVARCQLVEIAKAVSFNADLIVMDEPTSALCDAEIENLFRIVRELKGRGVTIIFISHKLNEIYEVCDSITVLRDGTYVGSAKTEEIEENDLVSMMVGREVKELFPKQESEIGSPLLKVKNLFRSGEFSDISFTLHRGEILGLAGLMGAGRSEVVETLFGLRQAEGGEVFFKDEKINISIPQDALRKGICLVPEDRKNQGLVLKLPVRDNIVLSALKKIMKNGILHKPLETQAVKKMIEHMQIKVGHPLLSGSSLSGGNQQKVVLARCLFSDPDVIILDEPTRGIDVKTKSEIHGLMSKLACEGKGVIMVSSELPEIMGMSDRVLVLHEGRITGELSRNEMTAEKIMQLAIKSHDIEGDSGE